MKNKDCVEVVLSGTDENIDYDVLFDKLKLTLNDEDKKALQDVKQVFTYYTQTYCVVDEGNRYETIVKDYKKPPHFEDCLKMYREYME